MAGVGEFPNFTTQIDKTKVMRNIVAGNWKSNKLMGEALKWMEDMSSWMPNRGHVEVMVAPPAPCYDVPHDFCSEVWVTKIAHTIVTTT